MGNRRRLWLVGGSILLAIVVGIQLVYPSNAALPFASLLGQRVGGVTMNELSSTIQTSFESSTVELSTGERKVVRKIAEFGVSVNSEQMARRLTTYPLWQRFIPGTILLQPRVEKYDAEMSGQRISEQAKAIAAQLSYAPIDATLVLSEGNVTVGAAKNGKSVSEKQVRDTLLAARLHPGLNRLTVTATESKPARSDADIAEAAAVAKRVVAKKVTIHVEGRPDITVNQSTLLSWLTLKALDNKLAVTINHDALVSSVTAMQQQTRKDAQPVVATVVDSVEQSRTGGAEGRQLAVDQVVGDVESHLLDESPDLRVEAPMQPLAPATVTNRSYTHSQQGLSAYVSYATSTQNVRIVVRQLEGQGWSASGREWESIPSASTYKLFVMLRVFDDINSGALNWDAPMLDTNAGGCFERTIVPSTNPCAEEWIRQYGRQTLNEYVHRKGFSSGTTFTASDATHTTAGDLANYLVGLHNGSLVSGNNRAMLLDKMGRQLYRYGIPTGTKGWTQDKVGFLWDYIHDAAIVHNPSGTYVLVVMTKGYSYAYIANVAKQIDTILYP